MIDERQEEQASLYALGLLESDVLPAFEQEMAKNPELRALVVSLQDTAAALAWSAATAAPRSDLKTAILAQTGATRRPLIPFPVLIPWALAASVTVAAFLLFSERTALRQQLAHLQAQLQTVTLAKNHLEAENNLARLQIAQLSSTLDEYRQTTAVVVWDADKQRGVLQLIKLPPAPANRAYQLWALDPEKPAPIPAEVFNVSSEESAAVLIQAGAPVRPGVKFAISVEPEGGSSSPQGPVILVSP